MCGATCPLVRSLPAGDCDLLSGRLANATPPDTVSHRDALAAAGGLAGGRECAALYGLAVVDADGLVRCCTDGAARAFGGDDDSLAGRPVASLVPELRLRPGTPGYNLAYALFWFPDQQWRQVDALTCEGQPFTLEVSISAARLNGGYRLILALRRPPAARGASDGFERAAAGAECGGGDASQRDAEPADAVCSRPPAPARRALQPHFPRAR